jgi:Holliday junction resolvasome RuvABC endonuclease subunit
LQEAHRLILRLIRDFRPSVVAIETAFFVRDRNAALLNTLIEEIRAGAGAAGVQVRCLPPSTIKKRVAGSGRATKREVARAVVAVFPELKAYVGQNRLWKERYHGNMFDAVALALIAFKDNE